MPMMPRSLLWTRTDTPGADHAMLDDRRGLLARGVALAVDPIPYTCRYELATDERWAAARLEVTVEGSGWLRSLRLERATGRWRASTAEQGDLDAALVAAGQPRAGLPGIEDPARLANALDIDLGGAPLFNTLPIRRLGLLTAAPGTSHRITAAWVLVPSLLVAPSEQVYTVLPDGNVRFTDNGFQTDLQLDRDGFVVHYPGLAELAAPAARR